MGIFTHGKARIVLRGDEQRWKPFDSVVVSGRKFFKFDEPVGIFICMREAFKNVNSFDVPYLAGAVPTITTSRSTLVPLKFWWKINLPGRCSGVGPEQLEQCRISPAEASRRQVFGYGKTGRK